MDMKNTTALISAFARMYHSENNSEKVFDDTAASLILSKEEYLNICDSMIKGRDFFVPGLSCTDDEALRIIVDRQLSPSVLGRAVFCEDALKNAVRIGAGQYLILGAGYDTFAYRQPCWAKSINIFEADREEMTVDKLKRLKRSGVDLPDNTHFISVDFSNRDWSRAVTENDAFDREKITFCSLLGVVYYLSRDEFRTFLDELSRCIPEGSTLVFDYPDEHSSCESGTERTKKQTMLAKGAGEEMKNGYSYEDVEKLLSDYGFLIYEHLTPEEITERFFSSYNRENPEHTIAAFDNVNYCLAVKKSTVGKNL